MAVRQMTGSMRLLRILHGLGHTVSTATVYRHDTALALLSREEEGTEITIPRNIIPNVFTTIVWDNNDFNEETVSGKGTTHVANGIIVQNAEVSPRPAEKKTISRSIRTIKAPETHITPYRSKERGTLSLSNIPFEEEDHSQEQNLGRKIDYLYLVSRKDASENGKSLSGWTGFNTSIYQLTRSVSTIGYLPIIDTPVTDMSTINTLLQHSISISKRLNLPEIVLVFDEAIYAKAQMIRWKDKDLMKNMVVRLGEFHTVMSFCSAISKIFKDGGLQANIFCELTVACTIRIWCDYLINFYIQLTISLF